MSREKVSGIYCIRQTNGEGLYVGSSVNIYRRWREHKTDLNKDNHHSPRLQNTWNKYGKDYFEFEILEIIASDLIINGESLVYFEQSWIDKLQPCFNHCPVAGSVLGVKRSPKTKAKQSAVAKNRIRTPEHKANIIAANKARKGETVSLEARLKMSASKLGNKNGLGKKHTPEHREKISNALKGKKHTPEATAKSIASKRKQTPETVAKRVASIKANKLKLAD